MSDGQKKGGSLPAMPRDLPMPPYRYQKDSGSASGVGVQSKTGPAAKQLLRGSNLMAACLK